MLIYHVNNKNARFFSKGVKNMANREIRTAAAAAGVRLWRVAAALGMTDSSFSRKLRFELSAEEKKKILDIIGALKGSS